MRSSVTLAVFVDFGDCGDAKEAEVISAEKNVLMRV